VINTTFSVIANLNSKGVGMIAHILVSGYHTENINYNH
jgi:hypothetical protein